eukprot:13428346-Alexandrium_andersonii.AAC.1
MAHQLPSLFEPVQPRRHALPEPAPRRHALPGLQGRMFPAKCTVVSSFRDACRWADHQLAVTLEAMGGEPED